MIMIMIMKMITITIIMQVLYELLLIFFTGELKDIVFPIYF